MNRFLLPLTFSAAVLSAGTAQAQDAHLARNLAATCANCHGTHGQARGDMPPLAGMAAEKIIGAMADFKNGARSATVMHQIAKGYTEEQIRLVAGYLASCPSAQPACP